jgi:HEAT repeat protein
MRQKLRTRNINTTLKAIARGDWSSLRRMRLTEDRLRRIAQQIQTHPETVSLQRKLLIAVPDENAHFDWNVGSLVPHWPPEVVADIIGTISLDPSRERWYSAIGLTWALGELGSLDPRIIDFLQQAVHHQQTAADAWWRAAVSLERLGVADAVDLLKASLRGQPTQSVGHYLGNLSDRRSVIGLLLTVEAAALPNVVASVRRCLSSGTRSERLNAAWLVGRLKLDSPEIINLMMARLADSDYEVRLYTLIGLRSLAAPITRFQFEGYLVTHNDPLFRREAAHALGAIASEDSVPVLKSALLAEREPRVTAAITRAIDAILGPQEHQVAVLRRTSDWHENGMIKDHSDRWYANPAIYHRFSESQDPNAIAAGIILARLAKHEIWNPIDLGTGTGKLAWLLLHHTTMQGRLYCVDQSEQMLAFLRARIQRQVRAQETIQTVHSRLADLPSTLAGIKSSLVVASFAFPSTVFDRELAFQELASVRSLLRDDGLFLTIGWDETFNDELNELWYRYIHTETPAASFEEWRRQRAKAILTARNADLTWIARRLRIPLRFASYLQAAEVMGHLFGRSAGERILEEHRTSWWMSLGITCDSAHGIDEILKNRKD